MHQIERICLLRASMSRVKCPLLPVKASTGAGTSLSCSISNALGSSFVGVSYVIGLPFLSFLFCGAAMRAKLKTIRQNKLQNLRNNFYSVRLM